MFGFTFFDALVGLIVVVSLLMGFSRGFTHEALKLAAWAAAIFITIVALPFATRVVALILPWEVLAGLIAMVLTFVITLMVLSAIGKWVGERIRTSFIGPLDRSLGALFGFLRGVLIVAAGFLLFTVFVDEEDEPAWIENARFRGVAEYGAELLADITPDLFEGAKEQVKEGAAEYSGKAREELTSLIGETAEEEDEEAGESAKQE